jgi:type II secretory pathway pseudopilin PulG
MRKIELLIVVVVISILGFITYKQFDLAKARSRDVQRKNDLNSVSKAIRLYFADYNHLPSSNNLEDPNINNLWGKTFVDDKGYVYFKDMPKENSLADKPYCYLPNEKEKSFTLFAQLEDSSDSECKKELSVCEGKSYCYTNIIYVNK